KGSSRASPASLLCPGHRLGALTRPRPPIQVKEPHEAPQWSRRRTATSNSSPPPARRSPLRLLGPCESLGEIPVLRELRLPLSGGGRLASRARAARAADLRQVLRRRRRPALPAGPVLRLSELG